ncbi:MAG: hypothetical protein NC228_08495, partial [[Eubacterium] siraeum]|nr:hypothetical protein [[Eubacterium] siraeum]
LWRKTGCSNWRYEWQRKNVAKELQEKDYRKEYKVLAEGLPNAKGFVKLGEGILVHGKEGFSLNLSDKKERLFFSSKQLYTVQTEYNYKGKGKCLVLSTKDCCYYLYGREPEFNPTRIQFAAEIIHARIKTRGDKCNDGICTNE